MASYIVRLSIEKAFATKEAADNAWAAVETVATNQGWTITMQGELKQP